MTVFHTFEVLFLIRIINNKLSLKKEKHLIKFPTVVTILTNNI